tara:strand:- start:3988 stop:6312 length:2325 start_codon:yes stop_codon:yes gene_type:complete
MNFSKYAKKTNDDFDFQKELFKYLFFWKYFAYSIFFLFVVSFLFIRYSNKIYDTKTKIKIIDKKEASFQMLTVDEIFSNSKINLENEIEVINSFPILEEVVRSLNLQISIYEVGKIMKSLTVDYPFNINLKVLPEEIHYDLEYKLNMSNNGFEIVDLQNKNVQYSFKGQSTKLIRHNLPFEVVFSNKAKLEKQDQLDYLIRISSLKNSVNYLKQNIRVSQLGSQSDIIELGLKSTNTEFAKRVLNELTSTFNIDGIRDRQLVYKRTIDFVNKRYSKLSMELDSIENAKQIYKSKNKLIDLPTNSVFSIETTLKSEQDVFSVENQISVMQILLKDLSSNNYELLPSNIGIENSEINLLITKYNELIIERNNLSLSAGDKNPSFFQLENLIKDFKSNIIFSLKGHLSKLNDTKKNLSKKFEEYDKKIIDLPEKEKKLRAIERNQAVKESLFLFLLTKREEAEVSLVVTQPSIKIVEPAISNDITVFPNKKIIFLMAGFFGISIPFFVLFLIFYFDNKIYSKNQLEDLKLPIPLLGEIPEIDEKDEKLISSSKERTILVESFRVLLSNLRFYTSQQKGLVVFTTSSIKGEGKTFTALNLSLASASIGRKVLLIGADLHNPQIHNYLNVKKSVKGLSTLLLGDGSDWKKEIIKSKSEIECDFILSGETPPNPLQLLNNGVFKKILLDAKNYYDYIVVDTPPCLPVSDTMSISPLADIILYVMRCNYTKIEIADYIKESFKKGIIKNNSLIVLNGLGSKSRFGYYEDYNFGYSYGYDVD